MIWNLFFLVPVKLQNCINCDRQRAFVDDKEILFHLSNASARNKLSKTFQSVSITVDLLVSSWRFFLSLILARIKLFRAPREGMPFRGKNRILSLLSIALFPSFPSRRLAREIKLPATRAKTLIAVFIGEQLRNRRKASLGRAQYIYIFDRISVPARDPPRDGAIKGWRLWSSNSIRTFIWIIEIIIPLDVSRVDARPFQGWS